MYSTVWMTVLLCLPVGAGLGDAAGTLEHQIKQACAALDGDREDADRTARALLREIDDTRNKSLLTASGKRRVLCERAVDEIVQAAAQWRDRVVVDIATSRGIPLPKREGSVNPDFPIRILKEHKKRLELVTFDWTGLSTLERELFQCYERHRLRKLLQRLRSTLVPPSGQEEHLIPIIEALVVIPLLTYSDSGFAVAPRDFLPRWAERPYFVTKLVEFCVLSANNLHAARVLDAYLSEITPNPDDDYGGHFHEHLAMVYRRNGMMQEAAAQIERAIAATRELEQPARHEIRLRQLLVEGYEQLEQYEQAGEETYRILSRLPFGASRRSFQEVVDRMASNLKRADRVGALKRDLGMLVDWYSGDPNVPVLLRQEWLLARDQGDSEEASELLSELVETYADDEQVARCKLDIAKDCLAAGKFEACQKITSQIISQFSDEWVAVEAADLLNTLEMREAERERSERTAAHEPMPSESDN